MIGPALYVGRLRHRRFAPTPHAFTYDLFMALLDIDRLDEQLAVSRLTAVNRFSWASYDDLDHLGDASRPLRARVVEDAARAGLTLPDGPIYLLTHLRYLGYNFNPISFYYCYEPDGTLGAVMAEVRNTSNGLCTYWLPAGPATRTANGLRVRRPKTMHVSPFMDMAMDYEFVLTRPGASLVAHMNTIAQDAGDGRPCFDATLTLARRPWTRATIRSALARHPLMTLKVIGAIHWEALRLWARGLQVHPIREAAPDRRSGRQEV